MVIGCPVMTKAEPERGLLSDSFGADQLTSLQLAPWHCMMIERPVDGQLAR